MTIVRRVRVKRESAKRKALRLAGELQAKPRTRPRKRNAARHSKEWRRAYGSPARCDFVASLPCVGCGVGGDGEYRCENAHVISGGKSRKADAKFICPLCHECHIEDLHVNGRETFEKTHNVDLIAAAAATEAAWQKHISSGDDQ